MKKKIHQRRLFFVVLMCASISVLLGASLDKAAAGEKIRFCIGSDAIYSAVSWMALKSGAFEEEGLEMEISKTAGGSKAAAAVLSGSVDLATHSFAHVVKAQSKGQDLTAIAVTMNNPGFMLVYSHDAMKKTGITPNSQLMERYASIKGLKIGVTSMGSGTNLTCYWIAAKAGLDQKDVHTIALGKPAARIAAMEKKTVDGLMAGSHAAEMIEHLGLGKIIIYTTEIEELQGYNGSCLTARKEYLDANPEKVRKFVRAMKKAVQMMKQNPQRTLAIAKEIWPRIPEPVLEQAIKNRLAVTPVDLRITEEGARLNMKWLMDAGKLDEMLPAETLFTNKFIE